MVSPVTITHSVVPLKIPASGELAIGALAVNVADGALYSKRYDGTVIRIEGDTGNGTLASADPLLLGDVMAAVVDVSGTTTISAITLREGQTRTVRFTGILQLTNGSNLVLFGSNITTAVGDYATFRGYAAGVVRLVAYTGSAGGIGISDDTATNATMYPLWTTATSGQVPIKVSSSKLTFNPSSGLLTASAIAATTVNKLTITSPATSATLTIANSKTLTVSNTVTLAATDGATLTIGGGGTLGSAAYTASTDYEPLSASGAWTPTDASGAGLSFTTAAGRYFKVGKLVFLSGRVTFPSTASTASMVIGGSPYTCGVAGSPQYNAVGLTVTSGDAIKLSADRGSANLFFYSGTNVDAQNVGQSLKTVDFSIAFLTV